MRIVTQFEEGVADVVVQVGAFEILALDHLIIIEGVLPLLCRKGLIASLPQRGHVAFGVCRCGGKAESDEDRQQGCARRFAGSLAALELSLDLGDHLHGLVVFVLHLGLAAVGCIPGEFALVDQGRQFGNALIAHAAFPQRFADLVFRQVCGRNQQLVGHISGERFEQLFVVGPAQILVQVILGILQPCPGHLVCPPVLRAGHVGTPFL